MSTNTPAAQILISLNDNGQIAVVETRCFGAPDSTLGRTSQEQLLHTELPFLLEELRQQIALGRRLTMEESAPLNAKRLQSMVSGSRVTE